MKYAILTQVLLPLAAAANMYTKSSPVLQLDAKSYDKLVAKSNYTSMVEFYAPWYISVLSRSNFDPQTNSQRTGADTART